MNSTSPPPPLSLGHALRFWLWLGFVSFGGPAGQIAIMHRELVERRRWISERRFLHALNYCMVLPGPEAQQLATYIGWLLHGVRGGVAAGALFILPSLGVLVALSWVYVRFGTVPAVAAILHGVKPAVVAIVLAAAWRIGARTLRHPLLWAIALAALLALAVAKLPFPIVILGAGVAGVIAGRVVPTAFEVRRRATHGGVHAPAILDDHTPVPVHARRDRRRSVVLVLVFTLLWLLPFGALAAAFGLAGDLPRMARFFTQAALLSFGGAYAVLPYVIEGAVREYGWLTAPQMIDGLALGETTPGPLMMVVAYVGFVGAWGKEVLGPGAHFAAGALGATVATWFTFLPSFLFILLGGPWVEATRDDLKLTAPLTAITAAVVGVIVNLALFFAWHVFWPHAAEAGSFSGPFDIAAVAIAIVASLALLSQRAGVVAVILASGAAGLALWLGGYSAV